jgi:hypothetical protein
VSTPTPQFINIQVIAIPEIDPATKSTKYQTQFIPPFITVTEPDTVINYQLVDPTPTGVGFSGFSVNPDNAHQLSKPSISESKKMVTFSDANTEKITLNITLFFKDSDGIEFNVDPEVVNEPQPTAPQV